MRTKYTNIITYPTKRKKNESANLSASQSTNLQGSEHR